MNSLDSKSVLSDLQTRLVKEKRRAALFSDGAESLFWSLSAAAVLALVSQVGLPVPRWAGVLLAAVSLIMTIIFIIAARIPAEQVLAETDEKLDLKQRLSASWEIMNGTRSTALDEAILADAADKAARLKPETVYPVRYTMRARLTPFLLLMLVLLTFIDLPVKIFGEPDPYTAEQGVIMEELGRRLEAKSREDLDPDGMRIAEEMQRLGKRLQDERINRKRSQQLIQEMTDRIQQQIQDLQRDLITESGQGELGTEDPEGDETYKLQRNQISNDELRMLRQRLLNSDDLTETQKEQLKKAIEEAEESEGTEGEEIWLAEDLMDELGLEPEDPRIENLEEAEKGMDSLARQDPSPGGQQGSSEGSGEGSDNLENEEGNGMPGQSDLAYDQGSLNEEPGETQGQQAGTGSRPGLNPDEYRENLDYNFQNNKDKPLDDLRGEITSEEKKRALIRTLPTGSAPELAREDLLVEYQRSLEEVIRREQVPEGMREFVRDYFLNIGIGREQKNESN